MQTVVLISPTNSTPSQSQKHDLWEGKTCQWLTDSLSLSLSLSHFWQNSTGYSKRILPHSKNVQTLYINNSRCYYHHFENDKVEVQSLGY